MHHLVPNMIIKNYDLRANERIDIVLPNVPYLIIIAVHNNNVSNDWRNVCCDWIVKSEQCHWALAWGHECSIWDDALDWSYIELHDFEIPDNATSLTTTWHENQTLEEVIEFAKTSAIQSLAPQDIYHIVILNIR